MKKKRKIVVTGGTGRFGSVLKKSKFNYQLLFPKKNKLNITKFESIRRYLVKTKPFCLIHLAGLSRPMRIHEKEISKSIELNIIGTANVVRACKIFNTKLVDPPKINIPSISATTMDFACSKAPERPFPATITFASNHKISHWSCHRICNL